MALHDVTKYCNNSKLSVFFLSIDRQKFTHIKLVFNQRV